MRVLVVGGTGPTGPHIVDGLVGSGHDVTILHRGVHEPPGLPDVEHVHADPHFAEPFVNAIGSRTFDVALVMYGRVKVLAAALQSRCDRLVGVGGTPVYEGYFPAGGSADLPIPVTEDHPIVRDPGDNPALQFSRRLAEAEEAIFGFHPRATVLRFPMLYGPRNPRPHEWSIVRRVRDGRMRMILPDGGVQVHTRCATRNAAAFVLAALDHPEAAAGQVYNCGDPVSWSLRQWAESVLGLLGADMELVAIPSDVAVEAATTLMPLGNTTATHCIVSTEKAERDLGYRPAVEPVKALAEVLSWYESEPAFDPAWYPSFADRFDYRTEDELIAAYRTAVRRIGESVEQHAAAPVHGMPHPKSPGGVDHRGR
jgi:nucleoside-diphosphate-sugar epimerase